VVVHLTARLGKGVVLVGFAYERSRDKVPSRKDRGRECGDSSSARRGGTRVMVGLGATEEGHLTAEEGDRLGWSLVRLATSNGEGRVQRRCHVGTVEWKRVRGSLSPVERRKKRGGRRKWWEGERVWSELMERERVRGRERGEKREERLGFSVAVFG
jgi:hypothetical protein